MVAAFEVAVDTEVVARIAAGLVLTSEAKLEAASMLASAAEFMAKSKANASEHCSYAAADSLVAIDSSS